MYKFKPYTDRIWNMRERIRDRVIIADSAKARLRLEAAKEYEGIVALLQRPMQSLYIISKMPLRIEDDDYFVGNLGNKHFNGSSGSMWIMANIEEDWPLKEDGLHHSPDHFELRLAISPADLKELREIMMEYRALGVRGFGPDKWLPDNAHTFMDVGACDYGIPGRPGALTSPGHLTPGYQNIIKKGYGAIRKQAQDWLDEREGNIMGRPGIP